MHYKNKISKKDNIYSLPHKKYASSAAIFIKTVQIKNIKTTIIYINLSIKII